jgi:multidrug resistance efflux pump
MSITSPAAWLALSALAIILFLIVLWGFLGRIPDSVSGRGILIRGRSGLRRHRGKRRIHHAGSSQTGDQVTSGQVVASMSQAELDLKIKTQEAQLKVLQTQDTDMSAREEKSDSAAIADYQKEEKALVEAEKNYRVQIQANQTEYDNQQALLQKGLTTQASVNKARDNLYAIQLQLSDTQVKESQIRTEQIKLTRETETQKNDRTKEINKTKLQLQEYIEQREAGVKVICRYSGRVIEKLVERGSPVSAKDRVITVEAENCRCFGKERCVPHQ